MDSILKPPVSERLKAGFVVLNPEEEIGEHTTTAKEEILIIMEGDAEVIVENESEKVSAPAAVFISKDKIHNVINCGKEILKYVYVVSGLN